MYKIENNDSLLTFTRCLFQAHFPKKENNYYCVLLHLN